MIELLTCRVCGKTFVKNPMSIYYIQHRTGKEYVCSYTCRSALLKEKETKK